MRFYMLFLCILCIVPVRSSAGADSPIPAAGSWSIVKHTSAMDDKETVALVTEAASIEGGFQAKPTLMLMGCDKRKEISNMALVLNGGEILQKRLVKGPASVEV